MIRTDPRTKLYLLLLGNLTLFFHLNTQTEVLLMALLFALFFLSGRWKTGLRLAAFYFLLVGAELFLLPTAEGLTANLIGLFSTGIRMLLPCIVAGVYAFSTTTVGEFICAMRKMHIPEAIIIPCVVVIRFFPTISQDYRQIRNAMALRGILDGKLAMLRHPFQSLEYILIPLLMNSENVAGDLTAAALTRGISLPGRHTCLTRIAMTPVDYLCMALALVPFGLFWGGVL